MKIDVMKLLIKIILVAIFFVLVVQPARDPDLGWHLRYGQYFFQTGHVLKDNILSFVWPTYQWVQASWGYDLIVYQIFTRFGFFGLSLTAGLLTFLTFLIVTWPQKRLSLLHMLVLGFIFLTLTGPMWGGGMRSATISTVSMGLAIVLADRILNPEGRKTPAWSIWLLPLLFLVWANLHGGFALGLILLSIQWGVAGVMARIQKLPIYQYKSFGLALISSWLTPLLNPWGLRIYEETFKHTSNTNLLEISEWTPLATMPVDAVITGIVVLLTVTVLLWQKKLCTVPSLIIIAVATYLTYSANRFIIVLGVLITYYLARELPLLNVKFFQERAVRWGIAAVLLSLIVIDIAKFRSHFLLPDSRILTFTWNDFCEETLYCSENITAIMRKNPPVGHGYHPYNYGGYLSWQVPQVKTFIDGRMAAWEENGQTPPVVEGDWITMPQGPVVFVRYDSQYHFQWAIVLTESDISRYLNNLAKSNQWDLLYSDEIYSYFAKRK